LPSVLRGLADAASRQGHEAEAEGALARALALLDEKPNPRAQAATLLALGQVRRRQGDWTGARPSFEQGLDLARALGDTRSEAYFLLELGYLESETGQGERGVALLEEARRLFAALADAKGLDSAERRQGEAQLKLAGSSLGMTLLGHDIGGQSNTRPVDLTGSDLPWPGDPGDSKRPTPTPRRAKREAGPVRGAWAGNPLEGLR
ncbi:MAG TPA: tetratricopeptide repeat protein, partial [Thermoanaerobaculia bacterium]|nr:tetratricopeptide repeat protein [Thermoanaerobaculia bacterium]